MGFTELLTIVFVVLKLTGVISWSWFFVCLPEIIALIGYIASVLLYVHMKRKIESEIYNITDEIKNI